MDYSDYHFGLVLWNCCSALFFTILSAGTGKWQLTIATALYAAASFTLLGIAISEEI